MPATNPTNTRPIKPGASIAVYRCRPLRRGELLGLLLLGGLAVLAPLAYGYARMQYAYTNYGPVAAKTWSQPWYWLGGLAALSFLTLLVIRLAITRRHIDVRQNGLILALSRRKFLPWVDLDGVASGVVQTHFLGFPLSTSHQAILYPSIGKRVRLDSSLENLPELLTRVKANLYPRVQPKLQGAFDAGQRLYFGPLAITKTNLRLETAEPRRDLAWEQVQHISVQSGMLVIELEKDEKMRIPVQDIPNLELLLQIIQSGVKK